MPYPFLYSTIRGVGTRVVGVPIEFPKLRDRGLYQRGLYMVRSELFFKNGKSSKNNERYLGNIFVPVIISNREFKIATSVVDTIKSSMEYIGLFNNYIDDYTDVYDLLNTNINIFESDHNPYVHAGNAIMRSFYDYKGFDIWHKDTLLKIKDIENGDYQIVESDNRVYVRKTIIPTKRLEVNGIVLNISYDTEKEILKAKHLLNLLGIVDVNIVTR